MMRFVSLSVAVCLAVAAAQPLLAQSRPRAGMMKHGKRGHFERRTGVLTGIDVAASNVTLTFKDGVAPLTLPAAKLNVVDLRGGKHAHSDVSSLAAGLHVVVRMRVNAEGHVRSARVKITG